MAESLKMWAVRLPAGGTFRFADLPIVVIEQIGRRHGVSWADLLTDPAFSVAALKDMLAEIADETGQPFAPIVTGDDALNVVRDLLVLVDDDEPPLAIVS